MSMLLEFSMFPTDQGESVGDYVARSLEIIEASGLPYRLNPMGTVIEGEWDELLAVVKKCYERMAADCNRLSCSIKIDWRRNKSNQLTAKIESVEKRLGRKLRT
ncbi:MAG: MTH1187 family thiamine-binding protein [Phycisphaerales bacterium]|nr:MTH1187 family thiamine-binding protein [Phycisphaerales bacterium]